MCKGLMLIATVTAWLLGAPLGHAQLVTPSPNQDQGPDNMHHLEPQLGTGDDWGGRHQQQFDLDSGTLHRKYEGTIGVPLGSKLY
jgi:hypothetical protein